MVKVLETGHLIVHLCPINYLSHVEWPVRCDWSAILCFLIFLKIKANIFNLDLSDLDFIPYPSWGSLNSLTGHKDKDYFQ